MPTAVLDLDADQLPEQVKLPDRYSALFALIRWRGTPIGRLWLPIRDGFLSGSALRDAVRDGLGDRILELQAQAWLGLAELSAPSSLRATIAICTRDRPGDLARCLRALARLPDDGQQVLVVDSASRGTETREVALAARADYVREEQPGLDRARNRALEEARHPIIAFTDDDASPDPGWLRALLRGFSDSRTLAVTGLILPLELETPAQEWFERTNGFGRGFRSAAYDGTKHDPFLVARIGAGANLALRKDALALVGAFDEALDAGTPTHSGGDHDYFTRILAAGYTIRYEPDATSWHCHRREWEALRRAVHGYGVGVYAYLTRQLVERGETRAPLNMLGWLRVQLPALARSLLRRPGRVPLDLALHELAGCARGAFLFFASRRAAGTERRGA